MDFIPKVMVIGAISPNILPGTPDQLTLDRINRAWVSLAPRFRYSQLQLSPDGSSANFVGPTADDGILIQPPLLQFRSAIRTTIDQTADDAQLALADLSHQLGAGSFIQLGIKVVCWAPLPDNDAPSFVLRRLFGGSDADFTALAGTGHLTLGAKFVTESENATYTTLVEPLARDPKQLFLDVDAQFVGNFEIDRVAGKAREVGRFVTHTLRSFLDNLPGA